MFDTMGLDSLILDLDEIKEIDNATMSKMLQAGGKVIKKAHEDKIRELFASHTGHLAGSPDLHEKMHSGSVRYVLIYPKGTHHTYHARKGGAAQASNQDVAFVHEFGGHGNYPSQWMRIANEQHTSDAVDAMETVFDEFLSKHNL